MRGEVKEVSRDCIDAIRNLKVARDYFQIRAAWGPTKQNSHVSES
jgi:hypothetical protein